MPQWLKNYPWVVIIQSSGRWFTCKPFHHLRNSLRHMKVLELHPPNVTEKLDIIIKSRDRNTRIQRQMFLEDRRLMSVLRALKQKVNRDTS